MREYLAQVETLKNGVIRRSIIEAENRMEAVHKMELWFWKQFQGSLGQAVNVLTVNDPYGEVHYGLHFNCGRKENRYLPEEIVERLLREAKGELMRDTRRGRPHNPRGSVCRIKRRRDFGKFLLPNIKVMKSGALYYRVVAVPQCVRNGRRYRKRKQKDIRLYARHFTEALAEISERGLHLTHARTAKRNVKKRSLALLRRKIAALEVPSHTLV
ncbi:MAG: hypothetical protein UY03_C0023G0032 [Parcubacteria group bacterium GW2011_GWA2_47_64]|nr:MAG: hypothetical protein UY03_C0023G0032 [Parcubacteria group bacterium GW2011_GWA2_47_64]KKU96622.1 MAG: hypothetical protein UY29_C0009G0036 [Parcubacteria group bacterium GW2011_GWC2_48_17]